MNIQVINNRAINMDKVSTVKVDPIKERIYFNLNFVTQNSNGMYIQDYVYIKLTDDNLNVVSDILNKYNEFVMFDDHKWVNIKNISSMKFDNEMNRIIINLSNPHTYEFSHGPKVLAEFIYIENTTQENFDRIIEIAKSI